MTKQKKNKSKNSKVFGVSFDKNDENTIPPFIFLFLSFLRQYPKQGIFRIPGSTLIIQRLKQELDNGEECIYVYSPEYTHEIASVVKMWFRELPEPLLTFDNYDMFIAAVGIIEENARKETIKKVLKFLPHANRKLLYSLCEFLHDMLEFQEVTKMDASNLAICFAPNLLRPRIQDLGTMMTETPQATALMKILLSNFEYLFQDYVTEEKMEREALKERAKNQEKKPRKPKPLPMIPSSKGLSKSIDSEPSSPISLKELGSPKPPPPTKSTSLLAIQRLSPSTQFENNLFDSTSTFPGSSDSLDKLNSQSNSTTLNSTTSNSTTLNSTTFNSTTNQDNYKRTPPPLPNRKPSFNEEIENSSDLHHAPIKTHSIQSNIFNQNNNHYHSNPSQGVENIETKINNNNSHLGAPPPVPPKPRLNNTLNSSQENDLIKNSNAPPYYSNLSNLSHTNHDSRHLDSPLLPNQTQKPIHLLHSSTNQFNDSKQEVKHSPAPKIPPKPSPQLLLNLSSNSENTSFTTNNNINNNNINNNNKTNSTNHLKSSPVNSPPQIPDRTLRTKMDSPINSSTPSFGRG